MTQIIHFAVAVTVRMIVRTNQSAHVGSSRLMDKNVRPATNSSDWLTESIQASMNAIRDANVPKPA